jgi:hypothetical protein
MIDLILGLFGGQLGAIVAGGIGLLAVFFGIKSKVKTAKIKRLETNNKVAKANAEVLKTELKLKDDIDELHKDYAKVDEVIIKSSASVNRDRLRDSFTRD